MEPGTTWAPRLLRDHQIELAEAARVARERYAAEGVVLVVQGPDAAHARDVIERLRVRALDDERIDLAPFDGAFPIRATVPFTGLVFNGGAFAKSLAASACRDALSVGRTPVVLLCHNYACTFVAPV